MCDELIGSFLEEANGLKNDVFTGWMMESNRHSWPGEI